MGASRHRLRMGLAALTGVEAVISVTAALAGLADSGGCTSGAGRIAGRCADSVVMIVLAALLAVVLAACAVALAQGRRWPVGPVLVWQLLLAAVAWPMVRSPTWYLGVPLMALCTVLGAGVLFLTGSRPADEGATPLR